MEGVLKPPIYVPGPFGESVSSRTKKMIHNQPWVNDPRGGPFEAHILTATMIGVARNKFGLAARIEI